MRGARISGYLYNVPRRKVDNLNSVIIGIYYCTMVELTLTNRAESYVDSNATRGLKTLQMSKVKMIVGKRRRERMQYKA